MSVPQIISEPEPEGIFRYYTHENAPWEFFRTETNPHAPRGAMLMDASDEWTVNVCPQMSSKGVTDPVWTGRYELLINGADEDEVHPLTGSVYDTHEDGERAAFNAGLTMYRVAC